MRARAWLRVSTGRQDEEQQLLGIRRRIAYGDRGESWDFDETTGIYRAHGVHGDDLEHPIRRQALADARAGRFAVLVVWALDRWTRGGILALLEDRRTFAKAGVRLVSVQEDWADNELLAAIAAWQAQQELTRKRERALMAVESRRRQIAERGFFVNRNGVQRQALGRTPKVTPHLRERMRVMAAAGQSPGAIARALGLGRSTVRDHLAEMLGSDGGSKAAESRGRG